jgi:nitroimidazol reductase NimA-like FMN-containing flavoprotein (pyridoxamine 5'-phosphate oxidase superfamily)
MNNVELQAGEIAAFLATQRILRLALDAGGERYLIPLGYVWLDDCLCCATSAGRKTRLAAANPRVSFQVDNSCETGPLGWTSVTGEGVFEIVTDPDEILRIKPALFGRFADMPEWARQEFAARSASGILLFVRIRPVSMSGLHNAPPAQTASTG